jgi:hypothetical protein
MSPFYWKPTYATRGQRHRAWVKQQARREAALRANAPKRSWLRSLFRRSGNS